MSQQTPETLHGYRCEVQPRRSPENIPPGNRLEALSGNRAGQHSTTRRGNMRRFESVGQEDKAALLRFAICMALLALAFEASLVLNAPDR